jgi:hypothetical protein
MPLSKLSTEMTKTTAAAASDQRQYNPAPSNKQVMMVPIRLYRVSTKARRIISARFSIDAIWEA